MGRPRNSKNKVKSKKLNNWDLVDARNSSETVDENYYDTCGDFGVYETETNDEIYLPLRRMSQQECNKKKKVAPRSGLQFKVGPDFERTVSHKPIYVDSVCEEVIPLLQARIDRGFEFCNGEWIGYKRNYFTLVACFNFENFSPATFFGDKFYTFDEEDEKRYIKCFAIRLVSTCPEDNSEVSLVQHTAKRDRGPQYQPPAYPSVPGYLPSHSVIKQTSNIRNCDKIDQYNKIFFVDHSQLENISENSILNSYPEGKIATVARYERIQFSTSINYRKPTTVNRHFILKVELLGVLDDGKHNVMASCETQPLVVRGRSPSNYQMSKKNTKPEPYVPSFSRNMPSSAVYEDSLIIDEKILDKNCRDHDAVSNAFENKDPYSVSQRKWLQARKKEKRSGKCSMSPLSNDFENFRRKVQNTNPYLRSPYEYPDFPYDEEYFPRSELVETVFDSYPFYNYDDFSLDFPNYLKRCNKNSSTKRHKKRDLYSSDDNYKLCIPEDSSERSQGTHNSSSNQIDDSFTEFQYELSMLQKELKHDAENDTSLLGLAN